MLCKLCGKEFVKSNPRYQVFCSDKCRIEFFRTKKPTRLISKECPECGIVFHPESNRFIFCSNSCLVAYWEKKRKVLPKKQNCTYCHKDFEAKTRRRLYCSEKCKTEAALKRRPKKIRTVKRVRSSLRQEILSAHDKKCWLCKQPIEGHFDIHHLDVTGVLKYSNNDSTNLVPLHTSCHNSFHNLSIKIMNGDIFIEGVILKQFFENELIHLGSFRTDEA